MKDESHFFVKKSDQLDVKGLVVLENITKLPLYGESVLAPFFSLTLNHNGHSRIEYDFKTLEYHRHDFSLIYPNHVLKAIESSEDYQATVLIMSPHFINVLRKIFPEHYRFEFHFNNVFHLNDYQYEAINSCIRQISILNALEHPDREELIASQVDIMARMTEIFMRENGNVLIDNKNGVKQLLFRFHAAIAENYTKHRNVKFYADLLCLSPKYFGTMVRKATGVTASEWIARYVMVHAKHLLRYHRDVSIQQISDRLGFADQTSFSHYFKGHTKLSPLEYRERK